MADIFISYAREDEDVTRRLSYLFELEEWSDWWDPQIPLGTDFRRRVATEILAARCLVVLWSRKSRSSRWVSWEVEQARQHGRPIAQLTLDDAADDVGELRDHALVITRHPHMPPLRDCVLEVVASAGDLRRRRDDWNACIHVTSWRGRAPRRPVIAWEWVQPWTEEARLIRRERWTGTPTVIYGTTIGNAWQFGHEDQKLPIGYLSVSQASHRIHLPRPDRSAERRAKRERGGWCVPFNVDVRLVETLTSGIYYPIGGVDLSHLASS